MIFEVNMIKQSSFSQKLIRLFNASFFVLLSFVVLSAASVGLFFIPFWGEDGNEYDLPLYMGILRLLLLLLFFVAICYLFIKLAKSSERGRIKRAAERSFKKTVYICVGILFAVQLATAFFLRMFPVTDVEILDTYAKRIVSDNSFACIDSDFNDHYIIWYQNNIPCLLIYTLVYKLTYFFTGTFSQGPLLFLNVLCINSAILMTVLTAHRLFGEKKSITTLIICWLFAPYYTYTPYFYTDTFSLPFVTGTIYAFAAAAQSDSRGKKIALFSICGALCCIGFKIKGSVIILLPAMLIYLLLHCGIKKAAKAGGAILLSFVVLLTFFTVALKSAKLISDESSERYQVPTAHWFMMGLSELGRYKYEDFLYTMSYETKSERAEADLKEIGNRLNQKGIGGTLLHLEQKIGWTYVDGTYSISHYIENSRYNTPIHAVICKKREFRFIFYAYSFGYQMFLLCAMAYSGFAAFRKRKCSLTNMFRITIFGAIIFFSIWESNARYLFNFTPLYILLATEGIGELAEHIKDKHFLKRKKDRQNNHSAA